MSSFGVTSTGPSKRRGGTHGTEVVRHDTLAAVAVVLVGLAALAFVLIVLPWVISI